MAAAKSFKPVSAMINNSFFQRRGCRSILLVGVDAMDYYYLARENDTDVHILEEDQQKINKFARLNAKYEELKDEIKGKQNELKNIDDASDDVLLLDEEAGPIPFMIGEVYIHCSNDEVQERLTDAKSGFEAEIRKIEGVMLTLKTTMSDLKTQLYAKFGSNINLEADEE